MRCKTPSVPTGINFGVDPERNTQLIRVVKTIERFNLWMLVPSIIALIRFSVTRSGPYFGVLIFGPLLLLWFPWRVMLARWNGSELRQVQPFIYRPNVQLWLDVPITWFMLSAFHPLVYGLGILCALSGAVLASLTKQFPDDD